MSARISKRLGWRSVFAAAAFASLLGALGAAAAPKKATTPAGSGGAAARAGGAPIQFTAADTVPLQGTWFAGPAHAPSLVLAPRGRKPDPGLDSMAANFQQRGFNVLTFGLRDPAPESAEKDSLRYLMLASRWVEDVMGAIEAARARTDSTGHLFIWGQGMGAALAVAAVAREPGQCDGLAAEQLYRTTDDAMKLNGTFVIPDAIESRNLHLHPPDEPISAAARLNLPAFAILVGPDGGSPSDPTLQVLSRDRGRVDRWKRPWLEPGARTPTAADADTMGVWFMKWTHFPRAR